MNIKCIITDDEPLARKGLQGYIKKIDYLELLDTCEDALQLNTALKTKQVDLLFLDIEMPYVTGIDFLKNCSHPPKVIFTTAYEKYAMAGYELDVIDYLLKPISFDRFLKASNKAFDFFSSKDFTTTPSFVFIKSNSKLEKINFENFLFAEAMENYVAVYTTTKKYIANTTLKGLVDSLPDSQFIQTHKSYVVNLQLIDSIEGNLINILKYQVPISKSQKESVMSKINQARNKT
jgi:DNA-binding LytR/AlgR family response regulator